MEYKLDIPEIERPNLLPSEVLRAGWIQGAEGGTSVISPSVFQSVKPNSPKAEGWCALGSLQVCFGKTKTVSIIQHFYDKLLACVIDSCDEDDDSEDMTDANDGANDVFEVIEFMEYGEMLLGWRDDEFRLT